ncbi:DUF732 domain-containing protein [Prescottella subtropica]|uniref:DUF732 domain-containing protein n=1 Tax=Prescottella subtropica TaxID=2545757 RepID=UPI001F4F4E16|nr:DUF732 domain-containing protein [Prescottella subtropica]
MTRSIRFGLAAALSLTLPVLAGCSSTPTDGEPVVIARSTHEPPTTTHRAPVTPAPVRPSAVASSAPAAVPEPAAAVPEVSDDLGTEDLLFLSYITEFTLLAKPESDQIRLGLSMCNALYRGQSAPEVVTEYRGEGVFSPAEIDNALGAATSAYCPEFDGATR